MWGAVLKETIPKGLSSDAARDPAQRIEHVLAVVERIRHSLHPASHLHPANAAQAGPDKVFTDDDMKKALKTWENNPEDWMEETTLRALDCDPELTSAKRHNKLHSASSTMQFQLLGNKHLIHFLIKYPVCSAEQPAHAIQAFHDKWADYSRREEYQRAVGDSTQCEKDHTRLSNKIWKAKQELERGQRVIRWVEECWNNWYRLSPRVIYGS
jgi:hypothetical protein